MTQTTIPPVGARRTRPARWGSAAVAVARRTPFTSAIVLALLAVGAATRSLWTPVSERTWFPDVAYGLASLIVGDWWTPVTGSLLALSPAFCVPVISSFALFVGFTEWRLGAGRTALICVAGQLVGVLGAAGTLAFLQDGGWGDPAGRNGAGPRGCHTGGRFTVAPADRRGTGRCSRHTRPAR